MGENTGEIKLPEPVDPVGFLEQFKEAASRKAPSLPLDPWKTEKSDEQKQSSVIKDKIKEAFLDYPEQTQGDITHILEKQFENLGYAKNREWDKLLLDPHSGILQMQADEALANVYRFIKTTRETTIPKRELINVESKRYSELQDLLKDDGKRIHFGGSWEGIETGNTRFYISLRDSIEAADAMIEFTEFLKTIKDQGKIPDWQYKIEGDRDQDGHFRFDPIYRDKGASIILYTTDQALSGINAKLDELYTERPSAFLLQKAPFKYSPHGKEFDAWHLSMEPTHDLVPNRSTPEGALEGACNALIRELDLTIYKDPTQLDGQKVRSIWESRMNAWARNPQKPWITMDRSTPSFFKE